MVTRARIDQNASIVVVGSGYKIIAAILCWQLPLQASHSEKGHFEGINHLTDRTGMSKGRNMLYLL